MVETSELDELLVRFNELEASNSYGSSDQVLGLEAAAVIERLIAERNRSIDGSVLGTLVIDALEAIVEEGKRGLLSPAAILAIHTAARKAMVMFLTSPWLAEHVRQKQKFAWSRGWTAGIGAAQGFIYTDDAERKNPYTSEDDQ